MSTQPTIRQGATGHVVRWAQYLLVRRELSYPDIDGIFGPYTRAAVERFQAGAGLVVDGRSRGEPSAVTRRSRRPCVKGRMVTSSPPCRPC
jgi:peptidoglycan hydrolase-like protein with peptidoglycan-binding domain